MSLNIFLIFCCVFGFFLCFLFSKAFPSSISYEYFILLFSMFLKSIYLFLEQGEEREKERVRNVSVCLPLSWPTLGTGPQPGLCPDWESNWPPFGLQAWGQSTELHQPGPFSVFHSIVLRVCLTT